MRSEIDYAEPVVSICSLHPFAAHCLKDAVEAENARKWKSRMITTVKDLTPVGNGDLLLLDGCCQDNWPKLAMRWQKNGGIVLVLLPAETPQSGKQLLALFWGVRGVVVISDNWRSELLEAVNVVMEGGLWMSNEVLSEYVKRKDATHSRSQSRGPNPGFVLTVREEQIMSLLLQRDSNKEMGITLGISERTVKYHVSNILQKKQAVNRRALLDRANGRSDTRPSSGWKAASS